VIDHLTPSGQESGNSVIMETKISVNEGRDNTGRRQRLSSDGNAGSAHTYSIIVYLIM